MKTLIDGEIASLKQKIENGLPLDDAVVRLHQLDLTIIESMKLLMQLYGISLSEAKQITTSHPIWNDVVQASEQLHNQAIKILKDTK